MLRKYGLQQVKSLSRPTYCIYLLLETWRLYYRQSANIKEYNAVRVYWESQGLNVFYFHKWEYDMKFMFLWSDTKSNYSKNVWYQFPAVYGEVVKWQYTGKIQLAQIDTGACA